SSYEDEESEYSDEEVPLPTAQWPKLDLSSVTVDDPSETPSTNAVFSLPTIKPKSEVEESAKSKKIDEIPNKPIEKDKKAVSFQNKDDSKKTEQVKPTEKFPPPEKKEAKSSVAKAVAAKVPSVDLQTSTKKPWE
ncbi:hypothetical protein PENTCL1PPCAC_26474, partial [Pristionchus entomophagus]